MPKHGSNPSDELLQSLSGRRFDQIHFRGLDAVVVRMPADADEPPQAVVDRHASQQPLRYYPVEGGHLARWPHTGGEVPEGCTLEEGGWNHEHCDACNGHIDAGHSFWQTADDPCVWLCDSCYEKLPGLTDGG
ncbi:hypothetical protein Pla123a_02120 [Posidoniimonas polymericola]|uniref:Uncharacterized protein n=1 Tax=Posidoniimonas polymericola TaxID=2528002 RepID=A0A5C5ZE11_9BACT|nr:hypothetical protein [Posidoniimonas polymericola]TWT85405.1 hypothetical protein Pla123a_02120 [Posidoniimonas polymericola]